MKLLTWSRRTDLEEISSSLALPGMKNALRIDSIINESGFGSLQPFELSMESKIFDYIIGSYDSEFKIRNNSFACSSSTLSTKSAWKSSNGSTIDDLTTMGVDDDCELFASWCQELSPVERMTEKSPESKVVFDYIIGSYDSECDTQSTSSDFTRSTLTTNSASKSSSESAVDSMTTMGLEDDCEIFTCWCKESSSVNQMTEQNVVSEDCNAEKTGGRLDKLGFHYGQHLTTSHVSILKSFCARNESSSRRLDSLKNSAGSARNNGIGKSDYTTCRPIKAKQSDKCSTFLPPQDNQRHQFKSVNSQTETDGFKTRTLLDCFVRKMPESDKRIAAGLSALAAIAAVSCIGGATEKCNPKEPKTETDNSVSSNLPSCLNSKLSESVEMIAVGFRALAAVAAGSCINGATEMNNPKDTSAPSCSRPCVSSCNNKKRFVPGVATKLHLLIPKATQTVVAIDGKNWDRVIQRLNSHPNEAFFLDEVCRTPLSIACEWGNDIPFEVMKQLLVCYPKAACLPDLDGNFPLHYYVSSDRGFLWQRSKEIVKLLIDAYPYATTHRNCVGCTPLLAALEAESITGLVDFPMSRSKIRGSMLMTLLKANPAASAIPNNQGSYPLHYSGKGSNITIIKPLLRLFPQGTEKQNVYGVTPLYMAVFFNSDIEVLKLLLTTNPTTALQINDQDEDPLTFAWNTLVQLASNSHIEQKRVLHNRKVINKATAPSDLAKPLREKWEKILLLLRFAYDTSVIEELPDSSTWMALHASCGIAVPLELVRFTLQMKRDQVFLQDEYGKLPHHIAAAAPLYIRRPFELPSSKSLMYYLLKANPHGASVADKDGRLPLHIAAASCKSWTTGGVKDLVEAEPRALMTRDLLSRLFPFMLAAVGNVEVQSEANKRNRAIRKLKNAFSSADLSGMEHVEREHRINHLIQNEEVEETDSVFNLLLSAPAVIDVCFNFSKKPEKQIGAGAIQISTNDALSVSSKLAQTQMTPFQDEPTKGSSSISDGCAPLLTKKPKKRFFSSAGKKGFFSSARRKGLFSSAER